MIRRTVPGSAGYCVPIDPCRWWHCQEWYLAFEAIRSRAEGCRTYHGSLCQHPQQLVLSGSKASVGVVFDYWSGIGVLITGTFEHVSICGEQE
ncbi:MAG TPA: hypothetical protein PKM59_01385 [Thermodesulfobacteriota bacterium]|nr:hypothetical protein [Thermodesulfobacteriota bacterium]